MEPLLLQVVDFVSGFFRKFKSVADKFNWLSYAEQKNIRFFWYRTSAYFIPIIFSKQQRGINTDFSFSVDKIFNNICSAFSRTEKS